MGEHTFPFIMNQAEEKNFIPLEEIYTAGQYCIPLTLGLVQANLSCLLGPNCDLPSVDKCMKPCLRAQV